MRICAYCNKEIDCEADRYVVAEQSFHAPCWRRFLNDQEDRLEQRRRNARYFKREKNEV